MKTKNLLSVMAFIAMLLVPSGALATGISSIYINVAKPQVGESPAWGTFWRSVGVDMSWSQWYDNKGESLSATSKFEKGKQYTFRVKVFPVEGYSITESTVPYINNNKATVVERKATGTYISGGNTVYETGYIIFEYTYYIPADLENISVTIPIPAAGDEVPSGVTATVTSEGATIYAEGWYYPDGPAVQPSVRFGEGEKYICGLRIYPKIGYAITEATTVTCNGKAAVIRDRTTCKGTYDVNNYIDAAGNIGPKCEIIIPAEIKTIGVTVPAPIAGATPAKGTVRSDGAKIVAENWYVDGNKMSATDKFVKGKQYKYSVMAYPKEGYYITESTKGTINDNKANITNAGTGTYVNDDNTGWLTFDYTFTAKNEVKTIAVTVPAPVAGAEITSNIGTIASTSEGATLTGSWWADPNNTVYTSGGKFEEGKQYKYMPILTAKDGWLITGNTQCTVNGKAATFHAQIFDGYIYAYLFDIPTGIVGVTNDAASANGPIFNLAGQRVGSSYKGLVIQNGKKVLKK